MLRKWAIAALGACALAAALATYHLFVLDHSRRHYRGLLESPTVHEKRVHYDEIHRFFHPWNPYRQRAERWLSEEGHEWEFLREGGRGEARAAGGREGPPGPTGGGIGGARTEGKG